MEILIVALVAGAILYANQAKQFLAEYKIRFIDAVFNKEKTKGSSYLKIFFSIRIEVYNPSDFTGTLQSTKLNLFYGTKPLGSSFITTPVTIARNGNTKVEIPVAVPVLLLADNILSIIKAISQQKTLEFKIKGDLNFAIGKVTVDETYKVALK